jgi:hypothetical protein
MRRFGLALVLLALAAVPSCEATPAQKLSFRRLNETWTQSIGPRYRAYLAADPALRTVEKADLLADLQKTEAAFSRELAEAAADKPEEVR